jgi:Type I phosphodiesterase / nucleotide pyrophosphatase
MVVLLVDALGWTLADATPDFAAGLTHRRRIETVLGFSSGALPTLFTGRMPVEHGRFLMYRRARSGTPFAGFGALHLLPPRWQRSWKLSQFLTRVVRARGVEGYFNLYEVPRALLERFDLPERRDIFAPGGLPGSSLWDTLAASRLRWRGWNWRTPETESLAAVEQAIDRGEERVLFCYTAELDAQLHREGSAGAGVQARLAGYAAWLESIRALAARRGDTLWIYLMSDHGMVDVRATADVMGLLAPLTVRAPRDFLAFYDSTMARFWWRAPEARAAVRTALTAAPGRWLEDAELERQGALFPDHDYGDDLFLLDPGVLMVPSFMGSSPLAAMHGYDAAHPDMAALLYSNRPVPADVTHLRDVRGFLEREIAALSEEAA